METQSKVILNGTKKVKKKRERLFNYKDCPVQASSQMAGIKIMYLPVFCAFLWELKF